MSSSATKRVRTLKVKCATWDHVEAFYQHKVKPGGRLPMRVSFVIEEETPLIVALELPSSLTVSIDGVVERCEPAADGKRSSIVLALRGFEPTLRTRLTALVADARGEPLGGGAPPAGDDQDDDAPPPSEPADVPLDETIEPPPALDELDAAQFSDPAERAVFTELEAELSRLREGAAHEVLGVAWDAGVEQIRRAYFGLTKRFHPDVFARYRSEGLRHLAQEIFIHVNRGYDRMRDAAVAAGAGIVAGPALLPHHGWLAAWSDLGEEPRTPLPRPLPRAPSQPVVHEPVMPQAPAPEPAAGFFDELPDMLGASPPAPVPAPPPAPVPAPPPAPVRAAPPPLAVELPEPAPAPAVPAVVFERPPAAAPPAGPPDPTRSFPTDDEQLSSARALLAEGKHDLAREMLAKALRAAPRNRSLRALYHVAAGRRLMAQQDAVRAVAQLEAALAHDRDCAEARAALTELQGEQPKKGGLFKRLFK